MGCSTARFCDMTQQAACFTLQRIRLALLVDHNVPHTRYSVDEYRRRPRKRRSRLTTRHVNRGKQGISFSPTSFFPTYLLLTTAEPSTQPYEYSDTWSRNKKEWGKKPLLLDYWYLRTRWPASSIFVSWLNYASSLGCPKAKPRPAHSQEILNSRTSVNWQKQRRKKIRFFRDCHVIVALKCHINIISTGHFVMANIAIRGTSLTTANDCVIKRWFTPHHVKWCRHWVYTAWMKRVHTCMLHDGVQLSFTTSSAGASPEQPKALHLDQLSAILLD